MKFIYEDLVKELENIDYNMPSFPILLYQNPTFRESIYLRINKLHNENKCIIPSELFYTRELKLLLNEMFEYWCGLEGSLKAIKRIDENMKGVIHYECDEPTDVLFGNYEMYYKRLTSKNKKRLYKN